jgi:uncharacterized membrane protein
MISGIVNREHETVVYRVEISVDGQKVSEMGPISPASWGKRGRSD